MSIRYPRGSKKPPSLPEILELNPSAPSARLFASGQVEWDIRVYLPTFIYIGAHILGPFLLNPVIMRGYY